MGDFAEIFDVVTRYHFKFTANQKLNAYFIPSVELCVLWKYDQQT